MISVGIDIGSYSIKIAEVESLSNGFRINDYSEIIVGNDSAQDHRLMIVDALRRVSAHYQKRNVKFVVGLSQNRVATRLKSFPFKEKGKILKSLPYQLSEEVPFDPQLAIFDAHFIGTRGKFTDTLTLITPIENVKDLLSITRDAGIEPEIVTTSGSAMVNFFQDWSQGLPELPGPLYPTEFDTEGERTIGNARAVLDIGHTQTALSVMINGHLVALRSIPFGGLEIARSISQKYEISEIEALKNLSERGFILATEDGASKDQIFFSNTISNSLKSLTVPLKRILLSLSSDLSVQFDEIYLAGSVGSLMNLGPFLTQELEVPCNPLKYLLGFPESRIELTEQQSLTALAAVALAVDGLRRPRNPAVNFRKNSLALQSQTFESFWTAYKHSFAIGASIVFVLFLYGYIKSSIAEGVANKAMEALFEQAKSPGINITRPSSLAINTFIKNKKTELQAKKDIAALSNVNSGMDILADISRKFPANNQIKADVRSFVLRGDTVRMEVEASDNQAFGLITTSLRTIARAGSVTQEKSQIQPSAGRTASAFTFKVNRKD